VESVGLHGRRARTDPDAVTGGAIPPAIATATVVLVTVRDAQVGDALRELAAAPLAPGAVVLHASGATDPPELTILRAAGHPCGTFHPLLPLVDPAAVPARLRGAWIGIDGDAQARHAARTLASRLGAHVLEIPPGEKARYHAAAVIASNFPIVLAHIAERVLEHSGVTAEEAHGAVAALVAGAAENLQRALPAAALTGPVVRGDNSTITAHERALEDNALVQRIYRVLTEAARGMRAGP